MHGNSESDWGTASLFPMATAQVFTPAICAPSKTCRSIERSTTAGRPPGTSIFSQGTDTAGKCLLQQARLREGQCLRSVQGPVVIGHGRSGHGVPRWSLAPSHQWALLPRLRLPTQRRGAPLGPGAPREDGCCKPHLGARLGQVPSLLGDFTEAWPEISSTGSSLLMFCQSLASA